MLRCRLKSAGTRPLPWNFSASGGEAQQGYRSVLCILHPHTTSQVHPSQPTTFALNTPSIHITRLGSRSSHATLTSPRSLFSALRFTAMQMPRHPLDLSIHSLTVALNGALAARRYAALHLLALRFGMRYGARASGIMCVRSWRS